MIFSELRFFVFFALVLALYHGWSNLRWRNGLLLVASLYSYALGPDWRFLFLLLYASVLDYVIGIRIDRARSPATRRAWLVASLVGNLGLLGYYKYAGFFLDSFQVLFDAAGLPVDLPVLSIGLPVGISFFTFQTMTYSLDIYRGTLKPIRDFVDYMLFVTFFTHLVAGPIVRAAELVPQIQRGVQTRWDDVAEGLGRFAIGFAKKVFIADALAPYVDRIFGDPGRYDGPTLWCASIGFAMQCYCDFAGYTDMAIGSARLLGFRLPENFRNPFVATSVADFWRRWHITLYSFMRDYLYIALGGSRVSPRRQTMNALITMMLVGLWHGAAWNFVIWGLYNGVLLVGYRALSVRAQRSPLLGRLLESPLGSVGGLVLTNVLFFISFQIFRSDGLAASLETLRRMLTWDGAGESRLDGWVLATYALVLVVSLANDRGLLERVARRTGPVLQAVGYAALLLVLAVFCPADTQAFVYFQF